MGSRSQWHALHLRPDDPHSLMPRRGLEHATAGGSRQGGGFCTASVGDRLFAADRWTPPRLYRLLLAGGTFSVTPTAGPSVSTCRRSTLAT